MTDVMKYAEAMFLIAEEDGSLETVCEELLTVDTLLKENPEYAKILDTPALSKDERKRLSSEAFASLSLSVRNLVVILTERRAMHAFDKLYKEFLRLYNDKVGIVEAEAVSAVALTQGEIALLTEKLSKKLSKKVVVRNTVDRSLLGGMLLRYDSVQLDSTVRSKLDGFAEQLKKVTV